MHRASKLGLFVLRVAMSMMVSACANTVGDRADGARLAAAPAPVETRRDMDFWIQNWFAERRSPPASDAESDCVAAQLHVQALSDDGARTLVGTLYAVGPASDPPLARLAPSDRARLDRAAELCGVRLPDRSS